MDAEGRAQVGEEPSGTFVKTDAKEPEDIPMPYIYRNLPFW